MRIRAPNERERSKLEGQRAAAAYLERKRLNKKKKSRTTSGWGRAGKQEEYRRTKSKKSTENHLISPGKTTLNSFCRNQPRVVFLSTTCSASTLN